MYIGSTGEAGLHHLVYEVVDNSVDEALAGYCSEIGVTIHIDNSVTVIDNGRGIPVGPARVGPRRGRGGADQAARRRQVRQGRLQGLGRPARRRRLGGERALGAARASRSGATARSTSRPTRAALPQSRLEQTGTTDRRGTKVTFKPDAADLRDHRLQLRHAVAAPARAVVPEPRDPDHARGRARRQEAPLPVRGRHRLVRRAPEPQQGDAARRSRSRSAASARASAVEIALQWNDGYAENIYCFANNINTHDGGTHLAGFRGALTRTLNGYGPAAGLLKEGEGFEGEDTREGLTAVISVKVPNPQFEGQTKAKLGNSEVKGIVESLVNERLSALPRGAPAGRQADRARRSSTPRARARRRARRAT